MSTMSSVSGSASISSLITTLTFTGQSKYAASFQQILNKAVQTDSVQLASLQDEQNNDQNRLSTLQSIDQAFTNLQSAVTELTNAIGPSSFAATVSNSSLASVSVNSGATAGTYQLEVDDLGANTQAISSAGSPPVTDPTSQNVGSGGNSYAITVTDPSVNAGSPVTKTVNATPPTLAGLVQTINATPSLGVSASIVNVGTQSAPDYRLALQAANLGNVSISVTDSNNNSLMSTTITGRNSSYKVDGTPISGTSDTITLAPSVTVNLIGASVGNPATITVAQSTSNTQKALQDFATAYNGAVDALATQRGQNAGALSGESILITAQQMLSKINGYSNNGNTLSALGLDLNTQGHLTFNVAEFSVSLGSNFASLSQFLGDSSTGFINTATHALDTLEDPLTGAFKSEENTISNTLTSLQSKITEQVNQVNQFQQNLYNQLAKSDAAVYSLSSQADFFTQLFQTETANLMGGLA